jgi:uncharacterized protein (DUF608 family)
MWYVLTFIVSFLIGWKTREYYAILTVSKYLANAQVEQQRAHTMVYVERHEDSLFVYEKETNQYLTNGKDMAEINKNLGEQFPSKLFITDQKIEEI